uniref:Uncharacterized protein n=1 Tax=Mustela putorius furo TaxID=9669 RepID=M3Z3A3_MUSPF
MRSPSPEPRVLAPGPASALMETHSGPRCSHLPSAQLHLGLPSAEQGAGASASLWRGSEHRRASPATDDQE